MIRLQLTGMIIIFHFAITACSEILEPISFMGSENSIEKKSIQEEFKINIKPLNFKNALEANKFGYERQLMVEGAGSKANVYNEEDFLQNNVPVPTQEEDYILGTNDKLKFEILSEFIDTDPSWPPVLKVKDYILGVGDQLILTQMTDLNTSLLNTDISKFDAQKRENENLLVTEGTIGSTGNILLLGLGNIQAVGRTLDDVRNEVRNILIRIGLAPNFQLEIIGFQSKKAFVNFGNQSEKKPLIVPINNIPVSLKEIALKAGLSNANKNLALITLRRNNVNYKLTATQLFDKQIREIFIQDKDQIHIDVAKKNDVKIVQVGSMGNILLPVVGSINVLNKTMKDVQAIIRNILIANGQVPSFQLDLVESNSKKVYLMSLNSNDAIIPLGSSDLNLKDIILKNIDNSKVDKHLPLVTIKRNKKVYRLTLDKILDQSTKPIKLQNKDQIEIKYLSYKLGQVFALSGAGRAEIVPIAPSRRETLADILFVRDGALSNLSAKRSEIYLLRGRKPTTAFHLDAQNVSRILVAAKTELRPNDIIYASDRPIISFSRLLSEIIPLRELLRDIDSGSIP